MEPQYPTNKLISTKKILIYILILMVAISVCVVFYYYFIYQKSVTLNPTKNTSITLGTQKNDSLIIDKTLIKSNSKITKKIKPGSYLIVYSSDGYNTVSKSITIDKNITFTTPDLDYSNERLSTLLTNEKQSIEQIIYSSLPNKNFDVVDASLYKQGNWYGARLIPKDWYDKKYPVNSVPRVINENNKQDILRVILKKEGDGWKVIAKPSIVFAITDYPNIPQDIIRDINKKGF